MTALIALACTAGSHGPATTEGSPQVAPGEVLPTLELHDLEGRPRSLAEFEGEVLLVDFWATWCAPCALSLPIYDGWQQQSGDAGLQILAVSVDTANAPVAPFAEDHAPNLLVLRDPEGTAATKLDLPGMPTAFLLDREGKLAGYHVGFAEGEQQQVLAQLLPLLED